jgi:hypothetical protein
MLVTQDPTEKLVAVRGLRRNIPPELHSVPRSAGTGQFRNSRRLLPSADPDPPSGNPVGALLATDDTI